MIKRISCAQILAPHRGDMGEPKDLEKVDDVSRTPESGASTDPGCPFCWPKLSNSSNAQCK